MRTARLLVLAVLLSIGTPGCTADDPGPRSAPTTSGGTATAAPAELAWQPVDGPTTEDVTVGGRWTLTHSATEAVIDGPQRTTVAAPPRHRITHALLDEAYAVVVAEDERARRPDTATVVHLATGEETVLDGSSDVPTTTGGTWALGEGLVLHATVDAGAYCLAEVDLTSGEERVAWCAPGGHGFSDARVTPEGVSLLTFDDARPSCRTVGRLDGDEVVPLDGVPDCTGWDGVLLDGATVWSEVPNPRRVEEAVFHATTTEGTADLGPGTSGSLTWCAGATYLVRDPQRSADPARLVRWTPGGGTEVVYETAATGRAFLSAPRCGGDALTLTAYTDEGDEQVTARLLRR